MKSVIDILIQECGGLDNAAEYARNIANHDGPLSAEYAGYATTLEQRIEVRDRRRCSECDAYPATSGDLCEGCHAYREHTAVY